jgi:hypothetical protein
VSACLSLLTTAEWQARAEAHRARVQQFTGPWRERRARGDVHPVYDFLFQYYHYPAGKLETWHPDAHEWLVDSREARERFTAPVYVASDLGIGRDANALSSSERAALDHALCVLRATEARPAHFGCFGMHEWAMVAVRPHRNRSASRRKTGTRCCQIRCTIHRSRRSPRIWSSRRRMCGTMPMHAPASVRLGSCSVAVDAAMSRMTSLGNTFKARRPMASRLAVGVACIIWRAYKESPTPVSPSAPLPCPGDGRQWCDGRGR